MNRLLDERKILTGIKEYLLGKWLEKSSTAKAYATALDELNESNFSTPLHKKIFRTLKNLEGVHNIEQKIKENYGDEGLKIVNTPGYPSSLEQIKELVKRLRNEDEKVKEIR
ncbi:hypothetical protein KAS42_05875 [bacterium]|nr:hypothetical protein [bacterium]